MWPYWNQVENISCMPYVTVTGLPSAHFHVPSFSLSFKPIQTLCWLMQLMNFCSETIQCKYSIYQQNLFLNMMCRWHVPYLNFQTPYSHQICSLLLAVLSAHFPRTKLSGDKIALLVEHHPFWRAASLCKTHQTRALKNRHVLLCERLIVQWTTYHSEYDRTYILWSFITATFMYKSSHISPLTEALNCSSGRSLESCYKCQHVLGSQVHMKASET